MVQKKVLTSDDRHLDIDWVRRSDFTDIEMEVLHKMARGLNDPEIAQELNVSYEEVRTYVKGMIAKTGLSRVKLAIEARRNGIGIEK